MTRHVRCIVALVLSCVLLGSSAQPGSLTATERAKLHPSLQQLVAAPTASFTGSPWRDMEPGVTEEQGVIVYTTDPAELRAAGINVQTVLSGMVTARAKIGEMEKLARLQSVSWIDPGTVCYVQNDISVPETGASLLHAGFLNGTPYRGKNVIVVIYDTGIDWKHLDFRDPQDLTKTRILAIWDQTITPIAGEASPSGFTYGVEYDKSMIEREINGVTSGVVREKDTHGHGTHVAGAAVGNGLSLGKFGGMAPEADIVVVKGGNGSFSETNMIDGLAYADAIGRRFGKPVVINWSIGGQSGPHDGTRGYESAVDNFVTTPGRVACISAGNDADISIHRGGRLDANGSDTIRIYVPAYTPLTGAGNDRFAIDGYLRSNGALNIEVMSPNGVHASGAGLWPDTTDGTIELWNYINNPNGNRGFYLLVSDKGEVSVPAAGFWSYIITNPSGDAEEWDIWMQPGYRAGNQLPYLIDGDNSKSVGMPGTSSGAITVGSYVTRWSWPSLAGQRIYFGDDRTRNISFFSGIGPTADGRTKPDIAAPGQGIVSSLSSSVDTTGLRTTIMLGGMHRLLEGTSMAAPHVTGACALLLEANPSLTAAQIKTYLQDAAISDDMTENTPNVTWGAGRLDVLQAMAALTSSPIAVTRTRLSYDTASVNYVQVLTGGERFALRLTPQTTGQITGLIVDVTTASNNAIMGTGNLVCEFFTNAGGTPGEKIGNTTIVPLSTLCTGTANYVQTVSANVNAAPGTECFAVLSVPGAGDTLKIRTDNMVNGTHSLLYNGSWSHVSYNYRIKAIVTGSRLTSIAGMETVEPLKFSLAQNYPNPFNPSTKISYTVPVAGAVRLVVFDLLGREVKTLVAGEQNAGTYLADWDGKTMQGMPVASGVYLYRLEAGGMRLVKKMMLLR